MNQNPSGRDPGPTSIDDRAFPTLIGSIAACLVLLIAASMTDETSLDVARHATSQELSVAAATDAQPAPMATP